MVLASPELLVDAVLVVVSVANVDAVEPGLAELLVAVEVTGPVLWLLLAEPDGPALAATMTPVSTISATVYDH